MIFYSTFFTSVWSWAYVHSTWIMRLFRRLHLPDLLNVEHKTIPVLGHVLALILFLVSLAAAVSMQKDPEGLTNADRVLCTVFKGRVCLDVAKLTESEQAQLDLIMFACARGFAKERVDRELKTYRVKPAQAVKLWTAACDGGNAGGCTGLGFLHQNGLGVKKDRVTAAKFYRQGCKLGLKQAYK